MSCAMKLFGVLSIGFILGALCVLAESSPKDENSPETNKEGSNELVRANFKLPQLFDFNQFKTTFKKTYSSIGEELVRKKIFLARAFQAFITTIRYKFRKLAYYLGINWMSDWTEEDLNRNKVHTRAMMSLDYLGDMNLSPKAAAQSAPVPLVSLEEIERELSEIERRKNEPGYEELASEIESLKRQKRAADPRSQLSFDDLMRSPDGQEPPEVMQKILRDPDRKPSELAGQGPGNIAAGEWKFDFQKETKKFFDHFAKNPVATFFNKIIQDTFNQKQQSSSKRADESSSSSSKDDEADDALPEVDHRNSGCFFSPRNQGYCGSCYAFTAIALYEWLYCRKTGNLLEMSEQYLIDCGQRAGLNGCDGGNYDNVARFVTAFGLELRDLYPYRAQQDQCPYEAETEPNKMGYLRFAELESIRLKLEFVHLYIESWPMMVALKLGPNFRQYAGGIDDNADCRPDDGHGMLLVGSGSEDGTEYWLLRNSHSAAWGEAGYYRLARGRLYECAAYDHAVVVRGELGENHDIFKRRPDYLEAPITKRYNDYIEPGSAKS